MDQIVFLITHTHALIYRLVYKDQALLPGGWPWPQGGHDEWKATYLPLPYPLRAPSIAGVYKGGGVKY